MENIRLYLDRYLNTENLEGISAVVGLGVGFLLSLIIGGAVEEERFEEEEEEVEE
jgi:hypothetical protein